MCSPYYRREPEIQIDHNSYVLNRSRMRRQLPKRVNNKVLRNILNHPRQSFSHDRVCLSEGDKTALFYKCNRLMIAVSPQVFTLR